MDNNLIRVTADGFIEGNYWTNLWAFEQRREREIWEREAENE